MNFQNGSVVFKVIDRQSSKVLRTTRYEIVHKEFSMLYMVTNITLMIDVQLDFSKVFM